MQDSIKGFVEGVHKVKAPRETVRAALSVLGKCDPRVLADYYAVAHVTGTPHYTVRGTGSYRSRVGTPGASGKGHSHDQALASGLMELVERWSCYGHLAAAPDTVFAPRCDLADDSLPFAEFYRSYLEQHRPSHDPAELDLVPVTWYPAQRLDGTRIYLPSRFICWVHEGSNGMTAGNSFEEAVLHGILEVVERHCQTLVHTDLPDTPLIDIDSIDDPLSQTIIAALEAGGTPVLVRDFSLGTGVPVVATVRPLDDDRCQVTLGAATTRSEALLRALTENVQTEGGQYCYRTRDVAALVADTDRVAFESIRDIDNTNIRVEIERVSEILDGLGMHVYVLDTTLPDIALPCAIVFIAGAVFHADDVAARTPALGLAYDSISAGRHDLVTGHLVRARSNGPEAAHLADHFEIVALLKNGDLDEARAHAEGLRADSPPVPAFDGNATRRARLALLAAFAVRDADDRTAASLLAELTIDDPQYTLDYAVMLSSGFDAETWAATVSLHEVLRMVRRLGRVGDADSLIGLYEEYRRDEVTVTDLLKRAERELAAGRPRPARDAVNEAVAANALVAEANFCYLTAARASLKLGERERALDELERIRALVPHDQKVRALLECLSGDTAAPTQPE
jgi:ribosomal protein S12 methylthiotransferase accessory factor